MKDFLLVFKVLYKNQNARRVGLDGKKRLPSWLTTILGTIPLAILPCILLGFIATIIFDEVTLALVSIATVSAGQLFALFLSMFSTMNVLFKSPDVPFLNTLPVSPVSVFFAKFAIAYLNTLSLTSLVTVPGLLTVSIVYASLGGVMFYGYFVSIFLIAIVAPILPLFIITVFSMPLSYIGTFFKGRTTLKSILAILFYLLLMVAYLLVINFVNGNQSELEGMTGINSSTLSSLGTLGKVMYPNTVLVMFCLGIDAGRNFGISLGITVGMVAIMLILAMFFYRRINQRGLETHSEVSHRAVSYRQTGIVSSLIKKDFKSIMRNPGIAMSSLANILVCPIITAIMYFAADIQTSQAPAYVTSMLSLSYVNLYTYIFLGGTNMLAMLAFTREGHSFYLSKSLPIKPRDSILAKFWLSLIPAGIILAVQVILSAVLYKLDVVNIVLFVVCAVPLIVGSCALHIFCDIRFGNVNWTTRQDMRQASQSNKGSLVVAFITVGIGCIALLAGVLMSVNVEAVGGKVAFLAIYWSILFALSVALLIAGLVLLIKNGEKYYPLIGERKLTPRSLRNTGGGSGRDGKMLFK